MSKQLENSFREALKDFEVPFDAKAWDNLSNRLSDKTPIKAPNFTNSLLWISGAVAAVIGVVIFLSQQPTENSSEETKFVPTTEIIVEEKGANQVKNPKTIAEPNSSNPVKELEDEKAQIRENNDLQTSVKAVDTPKQLLSDNIQAQNSNPVQINSEREKTNSMVLPKIQNACQNEILNISNPNSQAIYVVYPNGKRVKVEPKDKQKVLLTESGIYSVSAEKQVVNFTVFKVPSLSFDVSSVNEFDKGLPTVELKAEGQGQHEWKISRSDLTLTGDQQKVHLFKKGSYEIEYTHKLGECSVQGSKTIHIDEDYNLLAPNAFRPFDSQDKNRFFMPFALTERNTPFQLIILDPRYGKVVYQTSDANLGWDGIDRNTGNMVSENSEYVWKVILQNPKKGEAKNYSGTVMWVK